MKKSVLTFLFHVLAIAGFAQSQSDSNYSLGIKLLSVDEQPKLLNEVRDNSKYYTNGFNGLMLKINDNQISYRFQGNVFNKKGYQFTNSCSNCEIVTGDYKSLDLKIGFERSLIYSKLQPFYGFDIGYKSVNFSGVSTDKNNGSYNYNADIEKNGVGLSPFLGLKYNFIRALTLSAEAGFDFIYTSDKEVKSDQNNNDISVSNFNRWQYNARPLALLSLQYNFGRD